MFLGSTNQAFSRERRRFSKHVLKHQFYSKSRNIVKYNDYYTKKGFNKRPVCKDSRVHGIKLKPHLGYYPVQIEAYKKLVSVLCREYDIPIQTPMINKRTEDANVVPEARKGKYKGIVCHYHVSRNKIDCAGLNLKSIIEQLH